MTDTQIDAPTDSETSAAAPRRQERRRRQVPPLQATFAPGEATLRAEIVAALGEGGFPSTSKGTFRVLLAYARSPDVRAAVHRALTLEDVSMLVPAGA